MHVSADLPPDEIDRIARLDRFAIIDSPTELAFDEIARVASIVCGVPTALITFVDSDRQWFKARVGLDVAETPREMAFCAHTILDPHTFVVGDAALDSRFADNPLVTGLPSIRFYAGVPICIVDEGSAIGTLCAIDVEPRQLAPAQIEALEMLGRQVEHLLELRLADIERQRQRQEIADQALRFSRVVGALSQGVVIHREDGSIEYANEAAEHTLGLSLDQLVGRHPIDPRWNTVHEDGSPLPGAELPSSVAILSGGAAPRATIGVSRPDGTRRWLIVDAAPLHRSDLTPAGAVATFTDVTELLTLNERLRISVDHVTESALERIALLSALSHDLRAPLAAIRLRAEVLGSSASSLSEDEVASILTQIRDDAASTSHMLADLVSSDESLAELLAPRRELIDLDEIVARIATKYSSGTHRVDILLGAGSHPFLADPLQIERCVENLLSNAVRHTPEGTRIEIGTGATRASVRFWVDDAGPGVAPEYRESVFEPHVRTPGGMRRAGSGLGLFLVSRFVDFHGGTVECLESAAKGARFEITFPTSPATA